MQDLESVMANRQERDRLIKSVQVHQWIDSLKLSPKFKMLFIHSIKLWDFRVTIISGTVSLP